MKKHEKPSAARVGQLRAYLARAGCPPATANQLVSMAKTIGQIGQDLVIYLAAQPRSTQAQKGKN